MGNAIKFLKKEISCLPDTLREEEVSGLQRSGAALAQAEWGEVVDETGSSAAVEPWPEWGLRPDPLFPPVTGQGAGGRQEAGRAQAGKYPGDDPGGAGR